MNAIIKKKEIKKFELNLGIKCRMIYFYIDKTKKLKY